MSTTTSTLLSVSENLNDGDLLALKFLLQDDLQRKKLSKVRTGTDLFKLMMKKQLISEEDTTLLKAALEMIGQDNLASRLTSTSTGLSPVSRMTLDYNARLLRISESLDDDKLNAVKFLFQDLLTKRKLSKVERGTDLFTMMKKKPLITKTDSSLLKEALEKVDRKDLASGLTDCTSSKHISPFRIELYDIASYISEGENIQSGIQYFHLSKRKSEKIKNAFDLLTILKRKKVYGEKKRSKLQEFLKSIKRNDRIDPSFKACENGEETDPRTSSSDTTNADGDPGNQLEQKGYSKDGQTGALAVKDLNAFEVQSVRCPASTEVQAPIVTTSRLFQADTHNGKEKSVDMRRHLALSPQNLRDSIGRIGRHGTGFVIGGGCIMTTAHVLNNAFDDLIHGCGDRWHKNLVQQHLYSRLLNIEFTTCSRRARLLNLIYMHTGLDIAIVEVEDKSHLPPPFTRFLDVPDNRFIFDLLSHDGVQESEDTKCYTLTRQEDFERMKMSLLKTKINPDFVNDYDKFGRDRSLVEFCGSARNTASGSPGVVVMQDRVFVFTMLRAGFPANPGRANLPEELCVKQGVRMRAVRDHLKTELPDFGFAVFGNW